MGGGLVRLDGANVDVASPATPDYHRRPRKAALRLLPKSDALLTAPEGFEPSASGNLPSGQQGARGCENHWRTPVRSI